MALALGKRAGLRLAHLAAITTVVALDWLGQVCPLTVLESWLRRQAGETVYNKGFIEHWVQQILFYDAPGWVFTLAYNLFGLLMAAAWWRFPPRPGAIAGGAGP